MKKKAYEDWLALSDIKTYCKASTIKAVWY